MEAAEVDWDQDILDVLNRLLQKDIHPLGHQSHHSLCQEFDMLAPAGLLLHPISLLSLLRARALGMAEALSLIHI